MKPQFKLTLTVATLALSATSGAQAQIGGDRVQQSFARAGKDMGAAQVLRQSLTANIYDSFMTMVPTLESVPVGLKCKTETPEGKDVWGNTFSLVGEVKAQALAQIIDGLNLKNAEKIVVAGYFAKRPKSWKAFSKEIRTADQALNLGITQKVLVKNGDSNIQKLGYYSSDCVTEYETQTVLEAQEQRNPLGTKTGNFVIQIKDGILLKGENESITLNYDGISDSLEFSSNYNQYRIVSRNENFSNGTIVYQVEGTRQAVTPPNMVSATLINVGGEAQLQVNDESFDPAIAGQTVLIGEVHEHYGLFDALFHQIGAQFQIPLTAQTQTVSTGIKPQTGGHKTWITFRIKKVGNPYYNENLSSDALASDIKF